MASAGGNPDISYEERIARKKRVVNELLALRRVKHQRNDYQKVPRIHSPTTGRVYEAYRVAHDPEVYGSRVSVSREQVRSLIKGTVLEEELTSVYGKRAVDDAADSYVRGFSREGDNGDGTQRGQRFADVAQTRLFLHKLMKERKLKQEAKQQKYLDKEQTLLQEKANLRMERLKLRQQSDQENGDDFADIHSDSSDENVNVLVNEVKQKIGGLEKHIKELKQQKRSEQKPKLTFKMPPAIDYEFKPWQEEQVRISSEIVDEVIKRALDICVYSDDNMDKNLLEALLKTDNEAWDRLNQEEMKHDAMIEIINEIIEEVGGVVLRKVIEEVVLTNNLVSVSACDLVINSSHSALYGKPPKEGVGSKLVDKTWVELATHRLRARKKLWSHTLGVTSKAAPAVASVAEIPQEVAVEENEGELIPLSYELTPTTGNELKGDIWPKYIAAEFAFWESTEVTNTQNAFSMSYRRAIGISCISVSYDNCCVALGTFHGDVLVYDVLWQPIRPIRCVSFTGRTPERIIHIAWTLDKSKILTLSDSLCLIVWSVAYPSPGLSLDMSHLGLPEDKEGYSCSQLTALAILEGKLNDFVIKEGPVVASIPPAALSAPIIAQFSPVLNMSASQNFIMAGFASGEILKLDLSLIFASRLSSLLNFQPMETAAPYVAGSSPVSKGNKIANGIDVEVFRSHNFPILFIHFVKNIGNMVSIDQKMNVCIWKHSKDQLTGFNWYTPFQKLRLTGSEMVRTPKGEEKVIFEDEITMKEVKRGKKRRGKQIIEQERREAMSEIRTIGLQFRKPWHSDDQEDLDGEKKKKDNKFITKTYAPTKEEILDPGADQLFHILTRLRSTNQLVRYATRFYSVSSQYCRALIGMEPSMDGRKIFFMFLYGKQEPNIKPHISFVDLDLTRLDMMQSMVIKYLMDHKEFEQVLNNKKAAFTVTRNYAQQNSEYIYCALAGKMHVFSTLTGSEVAWCPPDKSSKKEAPENGLELIPKLGQIRGKVKLTSVCPDGKNTYIILQHLADNRSSEAVTNMVTLTINATQEKRGQVNLLSKQLHEAQDYQDEDDCPLEQCVAMRRHFVRNMPVELYIKMTLNSIIDNAVATATKERMSNEQRVRLWAKDWQIMQGYFDGAET